ncbi:MAG: hypothetical protein RLZZ47_322 [Bacteroidota bacterium]
MSDKKPKNIFVEGPVSPVKIGEDIAHHQKKSNIGAHSIFMGLTCLHITHSLGLVKAGEICLFVFASAVHRKEAIDACEEVVERIKKELPIWGKELFNDDQYQWKENKG